MLAICWPWGLPLSVNKSCILSRTPLGKTHSFLVSSYQLEVTSGSWMGLVPTLLSALGSIWLSPVQAPGVLPLSLYVHVCVSPSVYRSPRCPPSSSTHNSLPFPPSLPQGSLSCERRVLMETSHGGLSAPRSPILLCPNFTWVLNASPYSCMASTFLTEPSLQTRLLDFKNNLIKKTFHSI